MWSIPNYPFCLSNLRTVPEFPFSGYLLLYYLFCTILVLSKREEVYPASRQTTDQNIYFYQHILTMVLVDVNQKDAVLLQ